MFIAEKAMEESLHELTNRVSYIAQKSHAPNEKLEQLLDVAVGVAKVNILVIATEQYVGFKNEALSRIPQDADDWHTIALALLLNADIWTQDKDFFDCGIATWKTDTLKLNLELDS